MPDGRVVGFLAVVGLLTAAAVALTPASSEESVPAAPPLPPPPPALPPPLSPTAQKIEMAVAPYRDAIHVAADRWGVDPAVIEAIIWRESRTPQGTVDPLAARFERKINDTSYGLMQILLGTARSLGFAGSVQELLDPVVNIDLGTRYLASKLADYEDLRLAVAAYNSGTPVLTDHALINEGYVTEVLGNASALQGMA